MSPFPQEKQSTSNSQQFRIVAIGASAGGLEAVTAILRALPVDIAMAFVLIQHLDPKRRSMLPELLSRTTRIPVLEARNAMKIAPNHIYVMPSNVNIEITDGHFILTPRTRSRVRFLPVDTFMQTLATVHGPQAVGVVLSGTGSDGSEGTKAISAAGGITFAQAPETARFDGMPKNAIKTGSVVSVLPPEDIAKELTRLCKSTGPSHVFPGASNGPMDEDAVFDSILDDISAVQGANFREYKSNTIRRRTQQRMAALGIANMEEYHLFLKNNPEEVTKLSQHILVPVTEFFRNPEAFEDLASIVYPAIVGDKKEATIRVWVVACSTGEEVYSLAIALLEFLGAQPNNVRIQIFGTDLNEKNIAKARGAVYSESALQNLPAERVQRFFTKEQGAYRVNKMVRELCVFARQDVTRDPPFSNMDLVSCRNFLIYLQPELQDRIMSTLHYALRPSGFLLLGNAESAASYPQLFSLVSKRGKIYSKIVTARWSQRAFKTSQPLVYFPPPAPDIQPATRTPHDETDIQRIADRLVLSKYSPAGVIVNDALEILHFRGRTGPYLEPASGRANLNLLSMVREELAVALRTAITAARKNGVPVKKRNVEFEHNGKPSSANLSVIPLEEAGTGADRCYLVLFEERPIPVVSDQKGLKASLKSSDPMRKKLQDQMRELQATRVLLREQISAQEALRENFQSTNEELLSANEELQSTNEELETSKEELESANEELTTVNDELNSSNSALHQLGNDLKNLLDSTILPIVMVDSSLCIRRTTPMAETIFNVLPSDIGRPISDIRAAFDLDLNPLLTSVLRDIVNIDMEVQDEQGHWYRLQIRPYRTLDNRIDGATLVLFDIDAIKKLNQELIDAGEFTTSIVETMPEPVLVLTSDLRVRLANQAFYDCFRVEQPSTLNQYVYSLGTGQWNRPELRTLLEEVLPRHQNFAGHEVEYEFPDIGLKTFLLSGRYMNQGPRADALILLSLADITQRKKTEAALIEAEKLSVASRLASSIAHEINNPLEAITNLLYLASNGDDPETVKGYAAQALQELSRLSHITQQTLRFHRQSTEPSEVRISELVESLLVLFSGKLAANRIQVIRQFLQDPPVWCLAADLRQVFANLISNSIDAMKAGGSLTLRIKISVDWRDRARTGVRITLADSGTGMGLNIRKKIYEPFFTTKRETGTGLGMWVSAQIVERLQGDLRVWSSARAGSSGTTFSLFLPMSTSG